MKAIKKEEQEFGYSESRNKVTNKIDVAHIWVKK